MYNEYCCVMNIKEGRLKQAAIAGGIAGLSALGAIPLIGDLFRGPKSLLKGIDTKQADAVVDIKNICGIFLILYMILKRRPF